MPLPANMPTQPTCAKDGTMIEQKDAGFDAGDASAVVLVTVCYPWSFGGNLPFIGLGNLSDGSLLIQADAGDENPLPQHRDRQPTPETLKQPAPRRYPRSDRSATSPARPTGATPSRSSGRTARGSRRSSRRSSASARRRVARRSWAGASAALTSSCRRPRARAPRTRARATAIPSR